MYLSVYKYLGCDLVLSIESEDAVIPTRPWVSNMDSETLGMCRGLFAAKVEAVSLMTNRLQGGWWPQKTKKDGLTPVSPEGAAVEPSGWRSASR